MKKRQKKDDQVGAMLTEAESLRWGKMDAEMRNDLQGMRLADFEIEVLQREYVQKRVTYEALKKQLTASIELKKQEYQKLTLSLAEKYKVDPKKMAIDPDTGSIREVP